MMNIHRIGEWSPNVFRMSKWICLWLMVSGIKPMDAQESAPLEAPAFYLDTLTYMTDYLPRGVKAWPFNSDSTQWDLNGVKAPYIRAWIYHPIDHEGSPYQHKQTNAYLMTNAQSIEYLKITKDSIVSYGIHGVDLFKNGTLFNGYYMPARPIRYPRAMGHSATLKYKLIYPCDINAIPLKSQAQLPYQPDSIRIITYIEEQSYTRSGITLDLNLQRYQTKSISKLIVQSTRIETRKSNLAWQDITRFIRYPGLFRTDTIRETAFYTDDDREPVATIYHASLTALDKVVYKSPETFKDLTTIQDFKPNLYFFPNPYTYGLLRGEMIIKGAGLYTLRIVNIIGTEVWRKDYYMEEDLTQDFDFSFLGKGTYFMVFEQDKNHVLATKRLFVIK